MLYDLYVGSTPTHDAHASQDTVTVGRVLNRAGTLRNLPQSVWGVWEGRTERVAQYTVELADDATAQRVAYGLAVLTGNEAILVTRLAGTREEYRHAMAGTWQYRTRVRTVSEGNRTLLSDPTSGLAVGDEISHYGIRLTVTNLGTIAGWGEDSTGKSRRFTRDSLELSEGQTGFAHVKDIRGDYVSYLVWSDAHVSPVK